MADIVLEQTSLEQTSLEQTSLEQKSMSEAHDAELFALPTDFPIPFTEDELPYDDGEPMESAKHLAQMTLLIQALEQHYTALGRQDVAIHGNMGLYYSMVQARKQNFRAPDFFVVLGAKARRLRKSWVAWEEERFPNLVIEILSESTQAADRGIKKEIYQDIMRVPEYILHDVVQNTFEAYRLSPNGTRNLYYEEIPVQKTSYSDAVFLSKELGLELVLWEGDVEGYWDTWLRWRNPETGALLLTGTEKARVEYQRAEQEKTRAEQEKTRADILAAKLRELGINPDTLG